ncbi:MAG: hypothetical protein IIZ93_00350 [Acidaminococcaceae bacterium]|nr:hypothetical protein [Acidaminococcaceae bacterium]
MAHNITKEQMLEAIRGSNGITTNVQRKLEAARGEKISWDTTQKYIDKWDETRTAVKSEKEAMLDYAEHNILRDIVERHDVGTSKWYLKMKGKERGYEDTPTIQLANEDPLNINLTGDTMSAEDLKESADIEVTGGDPE